MKQAIQPISDNQPNFTSQTIKSLLPIIGLCLILGGGGLVAVFSQKPKTEKVVEKIIQPVEEKVEHQQPQLPPYTLFVEGEKVKLKFHSNDSDMEFSNLSKQQKVCLANGGGIGCVLPGYQPLLKVVESEKKPTPPTEVKRQTFKIPEIEASQNTMDNIMLVSGIVIGLILIDKFRKK